MEGMRMSRKRAVIVWSLALSSVAAFVAGASAPPVVLAMAGSDQQDPAPAQPPAAGRGAGRGQAGTANTGPRPYAEVITSAAKTDEGIFKVHRITTGTN